ncbi:hypothetical protein TNCV_2096611 [Trichonephila clavipes]|nr:hypothetical protein TNCV_2096611 [Trichonephila clavipes]
MNDVSVSKDTDENARVSTDDVVSWLFVQSNALDMVLAIHFGMAAGRSGLVSSHTKPGEVDSQKVMSGG